MGALLGILLHAIGGFAAGSFYLPFKIVKGWKPVEERPRKVSTALKIYAKFATSADKGAVRDLTLLD